MKKQEGTAEFTKPARFVGSVLTAEGLALREALARCVDMGIRRLWCESDSALLIKASNSGVTHSKLYGIGFC